MMQIVLKTLQTDSGDQPGSSCLSKNQKIKCDVGSRTQCYASRLWAEASPGWRSQVELATCVSFSVCTEMHLFTGHLFPSLAHRAISTL